MLRLLMGILSTVAVSFVPLAAVRADHQPVIALPGNRQVPVVINGIDATGAVVVSDWGLYAPGRRVPEVIGGRPAPWWSPSGGYFPGTGRRPRSGRREVEPRSRASHPQPAVPFYRSWSTESGPAPVTEYPLFDPPPVILAPRRRW